MNLPLHAPAIPLVIITLMVGVIGLALLGALAVADRGLSRLSVVAAVRER